MPDAPDAEILGRFVQGDEAAFEQLFRRFEGDVHGWIMRIVRDPNAADDVLVEAFWRAYRGRARFDPSRSFGAWMRRIASNVALDALRTVRPRPGWRTADDTLPAPADPDRGLADSIALAFGRLLPKLRIVENL